MQPWSDLVFGGFKGVKVCGRMVCLSSGNSMKEGVSEYVLQWTLFLLVLVVCCLVAVILNGDHSRQLFLLELADATGNTGRILDPAVDIVFIFRWK